MRRLALLFVLALVAGACGAADQVDAVGAEAASVAADPEPAVAELSEAEAEVAAEPEPDVVPTGREALASADGGAYALWFWGAH